jgi:hypothetical protein
MALRPQLRIGGGIGLRVTRNVHLLLGSLPVNCEEEWDVDILSVQLELT